MLQPLQAIKAKPKSGETQLRWYLILVGQPDDFLILESLILRHTHKYQWSFLKMPTRKNLQTVVLEKYCS